MVYIHMGSGAEPHLPTISRSLLGLPNSGRPCPSPVLSCVKDVTARNHPPMTEFAADRTVLLAQPPSSA